MEDIILINKNDFGIAFWWKRSTLELYKKINLVFNDIALHLTEVEVLIFSNHIETSLNKLINNCKKDSFESVILLETPTPQISFIMNYEDLTSIQNLIEGTLYELGLNIEQHWNKKKVPKKNH